MLHFHASVQDSTRFSAVKAVIATSTGVPTGNNSAAMVQSSDKLLASDDAPNSIAAPTVQHQLEDPYSSAVELGSLPLSAVHEQLDIVPSYFFDAVSPADTLAMVPYVLPSTPVIAGLDLATLLTQLQPYVNGILNTNAGSPSGFEMRSSPPPLVDSMSTSRLPESSAIVPYVQPTFQAIAGMDLGTLLTQLQPYIHGVLSSSVNSSSTYEACPPSLLLADIMPPSSHPEQSADVEEMCLVPFTASNLMPLPLRQLCSLGRGIDSLVTVPHSSRTCTMSSHSPMIHLLAAIASNVAPFLPTSFLAAPHTPSLLAKTKDLYSDVSRSNSTALVPYSSTSRTPVASLLGDLLAEIAYEVAPVCPTSPPACLRVSHLMQEARDQSGDALSPVLYNSGLFRTPTGSTMRVLLADIAYSLPLFQSHSAPGQLYITFPDAETRDLYGNVCSLNTSSSPKSPFSPSPMALVPYSSNLSAFSSGAPLLDLLAAIACDLAPRLKSAPATHHLPFPSQETMDHFGDVSTPSLTLPTRLEPSQGLVPFTHNAPGQVLVPFTNNAPGQVLVPFTNNAPGQVLVTCISNAPGLDLLAGVASELEQTSPLQVRSCQHTSSRAPVQHQSLVPWSALAAAPGL